MNGNRPGRTGLSMASWNCRKGLLDKNNHPTDKVHAIATFLTETKVDILSVCESALHGPKSRTQRSYPVTNAIITNSLRVPGYSIVLPESWKRHETSRLYLYIKDDVNFKKIQSTVNTSDLPIITIQARKGGEANTIVSVFYREFTGGVSGFETIDAQKERLGRILEHWRELAKIKMDFITLGDMNLCYKKWRLRD